MKTDKKIAMQMTEDKLVHFELFEGKLRAVVAITTNLTKELQRRHQLDPLATIAFGRAITCTALLASSLKNEQEYLHCVFAGDGPLKKITTECNGMGACRGYVEVPRLLEVITPEELPDTVGKALGPGGILTVTRGLPNSRSPYSAVSEFANGEIAGDVASYLANSEQIPSAVAAGAKLDTDANILGVGGVLLQKIGGMELDDDLLTQIEIKLATDIHISDSIAAGEDAQKIIARIDPQGAISGYLSTRPISFACTCSRKKMADTLTSFGRDEIANIEKEMGKIEIRCTYCAESHQFTLDELFSSSN